MAEIETNEEFERSRKFIADVLIAVLFAVEKYDAA